MTIVSNLEYSYINNLRKELIKNNKKIKQIAQIICKPIDFSEYSQTDTLDMYMEFYHKRDEQILHVIYD